MRDAFEARLEGLREALRSARAAAVARIMALRNHRRQEGEQLDETERRLLEGDPFVRQARERLLVLEERGPPNTVNLSEASFHFLAERPQHTYGAEIDILLRQAEKILHELGKRRQDVRWSQTIAAALRRGAAMHLEYPGCEGLNLMVQLLFRIGHVRVLLAGESLGCGVNLPCRAAVILDPSVRGAMLAQMTGRAGRRGLDLAGTKVFVHDLETVASMHASA